MDSESAPGAVVVGVDGSPGSDQAVDWATDQAARQGCPLTIVHGMDLVAFAGAGLFPASGTDYGRLLEEIRFEDAAMLARASARSQARDSTVDVHVVMSDCDPRNALLHLAEHAQLLVVGSRGRGPVASLFLGSVGAAVSAHATCPVVVLRPGAGTRPTDGILVGADATAASVPALEFALRTASSRSCRLTVLHCYTQVPPATGEDAAFPGCGADDSELGTMVAHAASAFPEVEMRTRLALGHAAAELVSASGGFELVVVGHRRHALLNGPGFGSVARTVLEHAHGPVAVVPSA